MKKTNKFNKNIDIKKMLVDMTKKTTIQVYVKYGIGIQTQRIIKEFIVLSNIK